jgi:hypothetical protein
MANTKHLTDIAYKHRQEFFLGYGEALFEKYSKIYSQKYPVKYISSPPQNNDFIDADLFTFIERVLFENLNSEYKVHQDSGLIDYRLNYYSKENQLKMVRDKNYLDSIHYFPFFPTGIPTQIRELLNENLEILEEYYKTSIESHLKRFFIRGHVKEFWLNSDHLYRYGFNRFMHQFNRFKIEKVDNIDKDLNNFTESGIYGLLRRADLYANYQNLKGESKKVQLLKFRFHDSPTNEPICFNDYIRSLNMNPLDYLINKEHLDEYIKASCEPINRVRELLKLPRLGEGWISETKLYYQIKNYFDEHVVLQHLKPKWLGRQHFDIYFPFLNIAIEYQGRQHFESIEYFGGENAFKKNQERDNRKRKLSIENGCKLIYVENGYDFSELIEEIKRSENFKTNVE